MKKRAIGVHVSIRGGISEAINRAESYGCTAFQIFTANQRQWKSYPLKDEDVEQFKKRLKSSTIRYVVSHDSYLINLGTTDEKNFKRSVDSLSAELIRCSQIDIHDVVIHPGSHLGKGEKTGLLNIINGILQSYEKAGFPDVRLLLETTAGQGTNLGYRFEHLSFIGEKIERHGIKWGVCFDTCHVFASGYDFVEDGGYEKVFEEFDRVVGLGRLRLFHINDSKKPLGSRVDRHEHLGDGHIGLDFFKRLFQDRRFFKTPMIGEPYGGDEAFISETKKMWELCNA